MRTIISKNYPKQVLVSSVFIVSLFLITGCGGIKADMPTSPPTKIMVKQSEIRANTKPLEERVSMAKAIFVGRVVNKVIAGDWVTAELLVDEPLVNVKLGQMVPVTWRATIGGRPIYDTAAGSRGVAILIDKHQGRYWLRGDKFEDVNKLAEVKKLIN